MEPNKLRIHNKVLLHTQVYQMQECLIQQKANLKD